MGIWFFLVLLGDFSARTTRNLGYFFNWKSLRELHKKDYPILWDGHLARPCIISGQDARTTRKFGIFF